MCSIGVQGLLGLTDSGAKRWRCDSGESAWSSGLPPICGLGWNLGLGLVHGFGLPLVQFLPLFRPCFFYARLVFSLHKNKNSSSLLILDARTFLLRPRLYGEKLSRVEGSPAFPSYPGRANFSFISLQNLANHLYEKKNVGSARRVTRLAG